MDLRSLIVSTCKKFLLELPLSLVTIRSCDFRDRKQVLKELMKCFKKVSATSANDEEKFYVPSPEDLCIEIFSLCSPQGLMLARSGHERP